MRDCCFFFLVLSMCLRCVLSTPPLHDKSFRSTLGRNRTHLVHSAGFEPTKPSRSKRDVHPLHHECIFSCLCVKYRMTITAEGIAFVKFCLHFNPRPSFPCHFANRNDLLSGITMMKVDGSVISKSTPDAGFVFSVFLNFFTNTLLSFLNLSLSRNVFIRIAFVKSS